MYAVAATIDPHLAISLLPTDIEQIVRKLQRLTGPNKEFGRRLGDPMEP
jgi:hypothetical protein